MSPNEGCGGGVDENVIGWSVGSEVGSEVGSDVGGPVGSDVDPVVGPVAVSEAVGPVGAVDEPAVAGDVAAVVGPTDSDGPVPGERVPVRPWWVRPGPFPGWPGFAGPLALWSGWSRPPAVSDAGLASMAWAPTYTATEATAVSMTPPTAVTAV